MNTKNMAFASLCCMSLNSGTMPPKLWPVSTEHGEMVIGYTSDRTIRKCSPKFRSEDQSLEDEKGTGQIGSLDNERLRAIVSKLLSKIHDKKPKKCLRYLLCVLQQHCNSFIYSSGVR